MMLDRIVNRITYTTKMGIGRCRRWLTTRHLYGPKRVYLSDTQVMVTLLARNSEYFIKDYLDYHFSLGADHILVIDNGSTDRTIDICKTYDRITVLQNVLPAKHNESGFRSEFAQRVAKGGWVLFADSDELIELPVSGTNALGRLVGYCNDHGYTAVVGQMLDHFSLSPYEDLRSLSYGDAIAALDHYSLNQISDIPYGDEEEVTFSWFLRRNKCLDPGVKFYRGGIRQELFDENPFLSKHSLVKNSPRIDLMLHPHCAANVNVADFTILIHHYKLAGGWVERDLGTVNEDRWEHKEDIRRLAVIKNGSAAGLAPLEPQLWRGIETLREQGFIYASASFRAAMKD
jgi:glycosyltransferase involved in cell wall biosynthesis